MKHCAAAASSPTRRDQAWYFEDPDRSRNMGSFLKNIPLFYLHRYLRIFPLLAAAILLQASLPHRIADGPEWDSVAWDTQNCRDNWWLTLLHVQNYFAEGRTCIGQTWYLAVDMQLYWISPLILVWLCAPREGNGHRTGWCAVTLGLLTSLLATSIYCFLNNFPVNSMVRPEDGDWYMDYYYINTLTRAPPFFVGMLYGYALHLRRGKTIVLPKVFVTLMWTATTILMGFSVYIHYPTLTVNYDNQLLDNFINSYMRATWAIALGWMIFACVHGYGGPINWFLSLQMWKLPARLSYAMYLLHFAPMLTMNSMRVSPIYFTEWDTIFRCFGDLVLSFLLAFALTLAVDSPFSTLQKLFFERGGNKQQHESASNKNNVNNVHDTPKREEMEAKTIF
ncbi:O-acyltransferase like protein [Eumeta japonica]|uniref:O-acyltransferase like protein n=1 Tax=Eumeta variegata TaxID=151549 RepID=A0A4C1U251_EUMVA|nr:O-acyltransferase like protein [Eumeta japonica]